MTEQEAWEAFVRLRFSLNDGKPYCAHCGATDPYFIKTRKDWTCRSCKKQFSATSGTIFSNMKMTFAEVMSRLEIEGHMAGSSTLQVAHVLGIQYNTARKMRKNFAQLREKKIARDRTGEEWTDEDQEFLKTFWEQGKPASDIASAMGRSRNAIIGAANRYKFKRNLSAEGKSYVPGYQKKMARIQELKKTPIPPELKEAIIADVEEHTDGFGCAIGRAYACLATGAFLPFDVRYLSVQWGWSHEIQREEIVRFRVRCRSAGIVRGGFSDQLRWVLDGESFHPLLIALDAMVAAGRLRVHGSDPDRKYSLPEMPIYRNNLKKSEAVE